MRYLPVLCVLLIPILACTDVPEKQPDQTATHVASSASPVASTDGLPIAFTQAGNGDVSVVLIHGWMCDQSYWDNQVPDLAESYRVVTIDLGGHGKSGSDRDGWPLEMFAEDVRAVVNHLNLDPVILVGHSMGGPVAVQAAKLLGDRVLGVVGVDTFQNVAAEYDEDQMAQFIQAMEADFVTTCSAFVGDMFPPDADATLVQKIVSDMCNGPASVGIPLMKQFVDADLRALFDGVSVPIRAVNADRWPTDVQANQEHIEDFDAVILEGAGHFLMMEEPEAFNSLLAGALLEVAHSGL